MSAQESKTTADRPKYTEDDGATWTGLPQGTIVSMNLWGFTPSILIELKRRFLPFLEMYTKPTR